MAAKASSKRRAPTQPVSLSAKTSAASWSSRSSSCSKSAGSTADPAASSVMFFTLLKASERARISSDARTASSASARASQFGQVAPARGHDRIGGIAAHTHQIGEVAPYTIGHETSNGFDGLVRRAIDEALETLDRGHDGGVEIEIPTRLDDDLDHRLGGAPETERVLGTRGDLADSEEPGDGVEPVGNTEHSAHVG